MTVPKSRRFTFLPLFISLLILSAALAAPVLASDRAWVVVTTSGAVAVTGGEQGQTALDARTGARLTPPFSVQTGHDAQLLIARGEDLLTIGPGARVDVPAPTEEGQGIVTRIRQTFGSVLYQVEHRIRDTFEAHTPYLVSVVKGTTFNILVTADSSTVALIEGLLHVYTPDGKYETFIQSGQIAVKRAGEDAIRIEDQRALSAPVAGQVRIGREDVMLAATIDVPVVDRLLTPTLDALAVNDTGISATLGGSSVQLGGEVLVEAAVDTPAVTVGGVALGGTALTPSLEIGDLSADLGGASLALGGDTILGVTLDDSSVSLGGASIGGTALTPSLDVGDVALDLGGVDLGIGNDLGLDLDLGDTSLDLGGITLGETALTPEIGLGDTSLNVGTGGIDLSTGLDTGILDPIALDVAIELPPVTETVTDVVNSVTDIVGDTTSTVINGLTGGLRLF